MLSLNLIAILFTLYFFYYNKTKVNSLNQQLLASQSKVDSFLKKIDELQKNYSEINVTYMKLLEDSNVEIKHLSTISSDKDLEILSVKNKIEKLSSDFLLEKKKIIKDTRQDALKRSRAVIRGQASEHLAPYVIPNTNPKDYRFMGNPIDFICFEGLSDVLDGQSDAITSVRFVDIKTGKASLNKTQRRIRDAIKEGKVTFEIINLDNELERQKNDAQLSEKCNS